MMLCAVACTVIGAHIATAHDTGGKQNVNPGLYVRTESGLTAGAYRNSYDRFSAYGGYTWQTENKLFALTVGAVTGYPAMRVMPVLAPSLRLPLTERSAARFTLLPKPVKGGTGMGLHFSLETEL
jgi:hypothetical protein